MNHVFQSARLVFSAMRSVRKVEGKEISITGKLGDYQSRWYHSPSSNNVKTLVVLSGFSVYGYKDPRINNLAKAFTKLGFQSIIIGFQSLEQLKLDPNLVIEIRDALLSVINNQELCPSGYVSILAPSFSASMVLNACSLVPIQPKVRAICCIGAFASIEKTIQYAIAQDVNDDYGRNVLFKNFLEEMEIEFCSDLQELCDVAILDNGFKKAKPELPKVLSKKTKAVQQIWQKLNSDANFRAQLLDELFMKNTSYSNWLRELSPMNHIDKIRLPVIFIHGEHDEVIPASESRDMFNKRKQRFLPSHLCITPLLDHGDIQYNLKSLVHANHLRKAFAYFLRYT